MSLRRRLVTVILLVVAAGLVGSDVATWSALQSFLTGRVDSQLDVGLHQALRYAAQARVHDHPPHDTVLDALVSSNLYLEVVASNGQVVHARPSGSKARPNPTPQLPRLIPLVPGSRLALAGKSRGPYHPEAASFDMHSLGAHATTYRAVAAPFPGGIIIVAAPLTQVSQTLDSLVRIEMAVSAAIILIIFVFLLWLVRLGLKPLREMADTANDIAGGDLTRRIDVAAPTTEVGKLATALNTMIGRIAGALSEQRQSEGRLRRFVADASHELRTPLASIRGYAELFRRGARDDPVALERAMTRIEEESARMSVLVDDLLLLARLDQGRPLERAPVDLVEIATRAVEDARAVEPSRAIELVAGSPVPVIGDAHRLQQVVANLLGNCRAHAGQGATVRVLIEVTGASPAAGAPASPAARLSVSDDGAGMEAEEAQRAFDRFHRGRSRVEGSGLGLSIVAAIVEAHGGRAALHSRPGGGTTVSVDLPLARSAEVAPSRPEDPSGPPAGPERAGPLASGPGARGLEKGAGP